MKILFPTLSFHVSIVPLKATFTCETPQSLLQGHQNSYPQITGHQETEEEEEQELECGPMSNLMVALQNIRGALCSTPQSVARGNCSSAMQQCCE